MKKLITLLALACLGLLRAAAQEMYAVYTEADNTLTFYYDKDRDARTGKVYNVSDGMFPTWNVDALSNIITVKRAVFDPSFADARPTTTSCWFQFMGGLTEIRGIKNLNTSEVTSLMGMFASCRSLTGLDLSGFDTSNVADMNGIFSGCSSLTGLDLSGFDTSNVTNMGSIFSYCGSLTGLDLSGFDTSNVTHMNSMFNGCSSLTGLDLSSFNTSNVTNMSHMFYGCSSLAWIYVGEGWGTDQVFEQGDMFYNCTSLVGGQGTVFDAEHTDKEYARVDGGAEAPGYLTAAGFHPYDLNGDDRLDVSDVTELVSYVLNFDGSHTTDYDLNEDGAVDVSDVTELVSAVLVQ